MDPWFGPKTNGYGFGPVRWQGWALIIGILAAIIAFGVVEIAIHLHD